MRITPILLVTFLYYLSSPALYAVSASGQEIEYLQPDGQKIRLSNAGDEWFHWHETPEGYVVSQDTDGFWKYTQPDEATAELKPLAQAIVGRAQPTQLGLRKRALPNRSLLRDRIRTLKGKTPPPQLKTTSTPDGESATAKAASSTQPQPSTGEPPAASAPTGHWGRTIKPVIILAAFSDHWNNTTNTVQTTKGGLRSAYHDVFNKNAYAVGGAIGSVRDFYLQNSYGELSLDSTVTVWVKLPQTQAWYGDNANEVAGDQRFKTLALDAINAANTAGFDFSQHDGDGDGYVDLLHIIYSGHSESWNGNPSTTIWPRQWQLDESVTRDGVKLNIFSASEALKGSASTSTSVCTIGTICHELGHQFGLPDLYDSYDQYEGVGTWCCMGNGCWGAGSGGDGTQPVNFSAHCRHILGFIKPTVMFTSGRVNLPRIYDNPIAHLVVPIAESSDIPVYDYFLIENRQRLGFDSQLPGDGILIWHILSTEWDNDSGEAFHPAVRLEEAAGGDTLATSRYAMATHLWHSSSGLIGGFTDTTGSINTNAMKYQGISYYTRIQQTAYHSKIRLRNFSAATSVMSYDLQTVVPAIAPQSVASANYSVSWNPSSDASSYQLQEGLFGTINSIQDDAETDENFWRLWTTNSLVLRSTASAHSGSTSYRLSPWDDYGFNYTSGPHSMQLNQSFVISPSTLINFRVLSHVAEDTAHLGLELSKDGGLTWISIDKISGYLDVWTSKSYNYQWLTSRGFASGDTCLLRFATRMSEIWGWPDYPSYGFALDTISVTGIQTPAYHSWANAGTASATTTRSITNKPVGKYAYRVRAMVNSAWQPYSDPVVIERLPTLYETWAATLPAGLQKITDDADKDGVDNGTEYALGRLGNSTLAPHDTTQLPVVGSQTHSGKNRLTLTIDLPNTPPAGATYQVQVANDLANTWSTILTKIGTADWTGSAPITLSAQSGQRTKHTVYDILGMNETPLPRRFMRLKVSLPQ